MESSARTPSHEPVLLKSGTIFELLKPQDGETVVDATLGLGGHSRAFADAIGSAGHLIAFDADAENISLAQTNLQGALARITVHHKNFRELRGSGIRANILFADLGLSSPHLDLPERGFSFKSEGPLDMRFDRTSGQTAASFIEGADERDLIHVLSAYGELKKARTLTTQLKKDLPKTMQGLRSSVEAIYTYEAQSVLAQVCQALRIAVNDELGALEDLLAAIDEVLLPGGRCGILSYHSLEDRLVKHHFRELCEVEKDETTGAPLSEPNFVLLTKKAILPAEEEIKENPRARSAKFRAIQRR